MAARKKAAKRKVAKKRKVTKRKAITNPKKVDRVGTQRGTVVACQPPGEAGCDREAWERPVSEQVLRSR
jgi:hypothetical protein